MEELLHYVWKQKVYPLEPLRTTDGRVVEVIDPGLPNPHSGPDFFNAKVKIGGVLWAGNVEVHVSASDWYLHKHQDDEAYANIVLHVVEHDDAPVCLPNGEPMPTLVLPCPEAVRTRYEELRRASRFPPCHTVLSGLPRLKIHSWLSALQAERLAERASAILTRLEQRGGDWEEAFFITLARNFGFGLNGDTFEAWASALPFRAVDKHRDDLFQVEAFFFGTAGLLEETPAQADDYYVRLQREYRYLCHKFTLAPPLSASRWQLMRTRPGNSPHVRLAQLAALCHRERSLFSRVMEAHTPDEVRALLASSTSGYWNSHCHFLAAASPVSRPKRVGRHALDLILVNTVIPFLYAYGRHKSDERLCERASAFLESLPAEDNRIVRLWAEAGLSVSTAADSQALIQLRRAYCDRRDCFRCRFGYEFLKGKTEVTFCQTADHR